MPVRACLALGEIENHAFDCIVLTRYLLDRPGALIAGCWAVMQHMGTE